MGLSFSNQNVLDITRRQLNILTENAAYNSSVVQMTAQQAQLLNVDVANTVFYNSYTSIAAQYEAEGKMLNGKVAATYSDGTISPYTTGDLSTSAYSPGQSGATFFPNGYINTIPYLIPALNGWVNPTSTNAQYEFNITAGLQDAIAYLLGSPGSGSEATSTTIPAGPVTGLVLSVSAVSGFSVNDIVSIVNGANAGLFKVTAVTSSLMIYTITVDSLIPSLSSMAGGTISNTASAIETSIFSNINLWKTMLLGQSTALNAQTDSRSTQSAQNTTALANVNTALSVINPWISSPSYTSGGLSSISSELATRQSFIPTRITQITTALGNVTVSGNTFSSSDLTSPYYNRYKWLDVRIDIASGSARRYFAMNQSIAIINGLIANNNALYTDYSGYFTTKALTSNDGSDILFVTDLTGLSNGDSINIISETLTSPVPLSIVKLMGTTQVQVNQPVPISYTVQDKARIYKAL